MAVLLDRRVEVFRASDGGRDALNNPTPGAPVRIAGGFGAVAYAGGYESEVVGDGAAVSRWSVTVRTTAAMLQVKADDLVRVGGGDLWPVVALDPTAPRGLLRFWVLLRGEQ